MSPRPKSRRRMFSHICKGLRAGRPRDHCDAQSDACMVHRSRIAVFFCFSDSRGPTDSQRLGVAGYNPPVMWGVYIITFVFWVGIGHAGTLISRFLHVQAGSPDDLSMRRSHDRVAVMTAALFPIFTRASVKFFWLIVSNWRYLWPQFKSPLVWDVFCDSHLLHDLVEVPLVGLIPDMQCCAIARRIRCASGSSYSFARVAQLRS